MNLGSASEKALGKITHYGIAQSVTAYVDTNCFYTHGKIAYMDLETGKAVASSNGIIYLLKTGANTDSSNPVVIAKEDGGKIIIPEETAVGDGGVDQTVATTDLGYRVENNQVTTTGTSRNNDYEISTLADLKDWRDSVNKGFSYSGITVKLTNDIDISGESWEPVGNKFVPFEGTFDGQNHKIIGLTNGNFTYSSEYAVQSGSSLNFGTAYGFFGVVGSLTNNDAIVSIKNVEFKNVNIDIEAASMVGACIGSDVRSQVINVSYKGNITVYNVDVSGTIVSKNSNSKGQTVGGVVGKLYTGGTQTVENCDNSSNITVCASKGWEKIAGVFGFCGKNGNVNITNCTNSGQICIMEAFDNNIGTYGSNDAIAGVVTYEANKDVNSVTVQGCTNSGNIISAQNTTKCRFVAVAGGMKNGERTFEDCTNSNGKHYTYSGSKWDGDEKNLTDKSSDCLVND